MFLRLSPGILCVTLMCLCVYVLVFYVGDCLGTPVMEVCVCVRPSLCVCVCYIHIHVWACVHPVCLPSLSNVHIFRGIFLKIYLFIFRGREGGREGEKHHV